MNDPLAQSIRVAATVAMATLVSGCDGQPPEARYPALYQQALESTAAEPVPRDAARRFVAFFTALDRPGVTERVNALYAAPLYFSDTLFVTHDRVQLAQHFERLSARGARIAVDLDDATVSGRDLYLRWRMRVSLPDGSTEAQTIGMTQLRFDALGRICFHQDFWDPSEGLYRRIPLLGGAIRYVDDRLAAGP